MSSKPTLLYINHGLGTRCGVHAYGVRHFSVIAESPHYDAVYRECNSLAEFQQCHEEIRPDIIFVNYMPVVMPWLTPSSPRPSTLMVVVQHFFDQHSVVGELDAYGGLFDLMVCLDPSLSTDDERIFAHARPVLRAKINRQKLSDPVQIGSFGFALHHKRFPLVVEEADRSFERADVNLHLTVGDFTGDHVDSVVVACHVQARPGITVRHTSDYLSDTDLISRLSQNHINALFYEFPPGSAGLSSAVDYLISAQRPVLITDCDLFRHVRNHLPLYPATSMRDIAENYDFYQEQAFGLYASQVSQLTYDTENMLEQVL